MLGTQVAAMGVKDCKSMIYDAIQIARKAGDR